VGTCVAAPELAGAEHTLIEQPGGQKGCRVFAFSARWIWRGISKTAKSLMS